MSNIKHNEVSRALGLPDGHEFEAQLSAKLANDEPVVIAAVDIDKFLNVNKLFGRDEGDRVIITLGRTIAAGLPEGSLLYRYGGDEFTVIFPGDYDKERAFLAIEKLREQNDIRTPDGNKVTISAGVAAAPDDATQYGELMRKAESAMMRAKAGGCDRVCLAREEKMVVKTTHYTLDQLQRLTKLSKREGTGEAALLREALDALLRKYDV